LSALLAELRGDDVPAYEGYKYIIVGNELLIIDPETWEIVAIIPV
jgi:hypothetical protein